MLGQVVYHLLAAAGVVEAPWPVVVVVSCVPVIVLGCAAALTHLIRRPQETADAAPSPSLLDTVPVDKLEAARLAMRATFAAGNALSQNQLEARYGLTRAQSREIRLEVVATSNGHAS